MVVNFIKKIIVDLLPLIFAQTLAPREGVVVNVGRASATAKMSDEFMPVYAVDVMLLDEQGEPDQEMPVLQSLPLPLNQGGAESGFFGQPHEGMKVVVSFIYGLPNKPYIQTILSTDASVPGVKRGDMIWTQGEGVSQKVDRSGNWVRETNRTITDSCDTLNVVAREQNETIGSRNTKVKGHWLIKAFGFFKVFSYGCISIVSGARVNISAAEALSLTAVKDINVNTADNLNLKSQKDIELKAGINSKCYVGNNEVNLVEMVSDLADQVKEVATFASTQAYGGMGSALIPGNPAEAAATKAGTIKTSVDKLV